MGARGAASLVSRRLAPLSGIAVLIVAWEAAVRWKPGSLLPGPWGVARAIAELAANGLLWKHLSASLFRVSWGYLAAVVCALPAGLWLGSVRRAELAFGPWLEVLRPISPLAWIPIAILWLGVGDLAAIAIIFFASFLPLTFVVKDAVRRIPAVHLQAGGNFGLGRRQLVRKVVLPAILPQTIVGLRLSLGIAWLVVVAAEMIAVNSGLGFLIIDARNSGNRYDLVVAGMALIGLVGLGLDLGVRRLEQLPALRGGISEAGS
ncbi:MAG TPA: ABC transporter permease [Thermoanaerobaculia bacterium]|nr:ABC transporter permease [Thermoanaerobaculia bacterium]